MWCCLCNKQFPGHCICADRDKRLEKLRASPHLAIRMCGACGKHPDLCKCTDGANTKFTIGRKAK